MHHARFLQQVQGTCFNPPLISEKLVMFLNQRGLCLWLNKCSTETGPAQIVTVQMQVVDADFFPSLELNPNLFLLGFALYSKVFQSGATHNSLDIAAYFPVWIFTTLQQPL